MRVPPSGLSKYIPYRDSSVIRLHGEEDYERRLSVTADCFCRFVDTKIPTNDKTTPDNDLCCTGFLFDVAWFIELAR